MLVSSFLYLLLFLYNCITKAARGGGAMISPLTVLVKVGLGNKAL